MRFEFIDMSDLGLRAVIKAYNIVHIIHTFQNGVRPCVETTPFRTSPIMLSGVIVHDLITFLKHNWFDNTIVLIFHVRRLLAVTHADHSPDLHSAAM